MYDKNDLKNGAAEILKAFSVPYPYGMQDPRELVPYAQALYIAKDPQAYEIFLDHYANYPTASADVLGHIAYQFDLAGHPDYAKRLLDLAGQNPDVLKTYQGLKNAPLNPADLPPTSTKA